MTDESFTPMGPHADLYAELDPPVRQLLAAPPYEEVRARYVDVGVWCWCPVCAYRVSEVRVFSIFDRHLVASAEEITGYQLRPCRHYVTRVVWHMNPDGVPAGQADTSLPPQPPPFAAEPDGWPYGDRCHQPFEPSVTGLATNVPACRCGGDPRRPRHLYRHLARPNPAIIDGGGCCTWHCPLCGDSTEWFGREKRRLPGWRPWRRWVHTICPPAYPYSATGVDPNWRPSTPAPPYPLQPGQSTVCLLDHDCGPDCPPRYGRG